MLLWCIIQLFSQCNSLFFKFVTDSVKFFQVLVLLFLLVFKDWDSEENKTNNISVDTTWSVPLTLRIGGPLSLIHHLTFNTINWQKNILNYMSPQSSLTLASFWVYHCLISYTEPLWTVAVHCWVIVFRTWCTLKCSEPSCPMKVTEL